MFGISNNPYPVFQAQPATPVGLVTVRVALFSLSVILLLSFQEAVPAWNVSYWLTVAIGLTSMMLFLWAKTGDNHAPLEVSGGLDLLLLFMAIYVLAEGTAAGLIPGGMMELALVLTIPIGVLHFGYLMGGTVGMTVGAWYFLMYAQVVGAPSGMGPARVQGTLALVLGALISLLVQTMRQDREPEPADSAVMRLSVERDRVDVDADANDREFPIAA